ncbi:MAG: glycosyltransferase 87 family protein [Nocardioidaceae bacterium]
MATAGHALGDARFAAAAGLGVCVWLLRRQASEGEARAAATALVLLPGSFTMVWNGWTDVHVLLLLVLVVIAALREWRATPYVIGALIVSKQYMIVAVPLLVLLLPVARRTPSDVRGFALRAAIAAATLTVPWILWSPSAFWDSVVRLQFRQPFRVDSISLLVEVVNATGWPPPATYGIIPLAAGLLTATAMAWRAPRTPAAFAAALSVTLTVTFLLSSQGHSNYYFLPAAGLLVACVTWPAPGFTSRETGEKVGETPIDTERTNHIGVFRPLS